MPSVTDLVTVLHRIALSAFVGVTSASMLVAVLSRLRLRRPLLVWRQFGPYRFTRFPVGPILFLLLVAGGIGHAGLTGRPVPPAVLVGYPAGGLFWFVATWLSRSVVVTEYGIVPDVHRVRRAVVWSQIVDYFTTTRDGQSHFVFFYRGSDGDRRRLDLPVPEAHAPVVREIVERKLDARFSVSGDDVYGEEGIDRLDDRIGRS